MSKLLTKAGLGAVVALCALAMPSQASTVLNFFTTGTGCTVSGGGCGTASGSGGTLTALDIKDFTGFTEQVNGGTVENWTLSSTTFIYSAGVYTLTGAASCSAGLCAGDNTGNIQLLTINGAAPTYAGGSGSQVISIGAATSLTETATFLNDLGLTVPTGTPTVSGGASTTGNTSPFTLNQSATLSITTTQNYVTPEPVSFLLFGTGLFAVAWIARKTKRTASVPTV